MITSITVNGFKTLSDFNLVLNPGLNILVGPNGSGKTNIISFFEFLSHIVERDPSEATSYLGGAGAVFRRVEDTYEAKITARITGCYSLSEGRFSRSTSKDRYALYEYCFDILFSNELESVALTSQKFRYKHCFDFVSACDFDKKGTDWDLDVEMKLKPNMRVEAKVRSLKASTEVLPFFNKSKGDSHIKEAEKFLSQFASPSVSIPSLLSRFNPAMLLLFDDLAGGQAYNIIPSRVKITEDSAKPPGISSDGSGLSATLYSLRRRSLESPAQMQFWNVYTPSTTFGLKRPSLDTLKSYFQLANSSIQDVDVENDHFSNQLSVKFKIKSGEHTATVPLSLMSDGTLKWLTLLTAALTATSVFSIEEPENYLHPQMQGQFINIMREILFTERKHACTLMTTHSETLLNHCKPRELIVVYLKDGKTIGIRCQNELDVSAEIEKTGFGLGYYYIAGALQND